MSGGSRLRRRYRSLLAGEERLAGITMLKFSYISLKDCSLCGLCVFGDVECCSQAVGMRSFRSEEGPRAEPDSS